MVLTIKPVAFVNQGVVLISDLLICYFFEILEVKCFDRTFLGSEDDFIFGDDIRVAIRVPKEPKLPLDIPRLLFRVRVYVPNENGAELHPLLVKNYDAQRRVAAHHNLLDFRVIGARKCKVHFFELLVSYPLIQSAVFDFVCVPHEQVLVIHNKFRAVEYLFRFVNKVVDLVIDLVRTSDRGGMN
jgi:hypothetical protein